MNARRRYFCPTYVFAGCIGLISFDAWAQVAKESPVKCEEFDKIEPDAVKEAELRFEAGNQMVSKFLFDEAVQEYQVALELWPNPRIYYNLSRAQFARKNYLFAYQSIKRAMECGPEFLAQDPEEAQDLYDKALALERRFRAELARVVLYPQEPGIDITTDGEMKRGLQSSYEELMMPQEHMITAEKQGHVTRSKTLSPERGETMNVVITSEHEIPEWIPWTVMTTGLAVGAVGGGLLYGSWKKQGNLAEEADDTCDLEGCRPAAADRFRTEWAETNRQAEWGLGGIIAGSSILLGGLGLFLWNRMPVLQISPTQDVQPMLVPTVSSEGAGLTGRMTF